MNLYLFFYHCRRSIFLIKTLFASLANSLGRLLRLTNLDKSVDLCKKEREENFRQEKRM